VSSTATLRRRALPSAAKPHASACSAAARRARARACPAAAERVVLLLRRIRSFPHPRVDTRACRARFGWGRSSSSRARRWVAGELWRTSVVILNDDPFPQGVEDPEDQVRSVGAHVVPGVFLCYCLPRCARPAGDAALAFGGR
jgi:hypothetical protein